MEEILRALFDFQVFAGDESLRRVIDAVHARRDARGTQDSPVALGLDELSRLAAAGIPHREKTGL